MATLRAERPLSPAALAELQALPIWAVWCYETDNKGKRTKRPYNCRTGGGASSTKPQTWSSYKHACYKLKTGHRYADGAQRAFDGIGCFNNGNYVFLDWDHCRDQETGTINEQALAQIQAINSYSEISVSETGVHTIVRGTIPAAVKLPEIEMYPRARFLTFSGEHLVGTPETIEERTEQLTALYHAITPKEPAQKKRPAPARSPYELFSFDDTALLDLARRAKNGAKFAALYAGNWSGYASQSEADQALCNILAFWTGSDATRIDRLFRGSGLYREKWDHAARAADESYGQGTIARAIDRATEWYHPPEPGEELTEEEEPANEEEAAPDYAELIIDLEGARRRIQALEEENRELKTENHTLRKEIRFVRKVDAIPASVESVSQKATFKNLARALNGRAPDTEDGFFRVEPWRIATWSGQSAQTVRDNITYYAEKIPALEKKLMKVPDELAPQGFHYETYVKPTEYFAPEKHQVREDEQRKQGGKQYACTCGSTNILRKVKDICADCGAVLKETATWINGEPYTQSQVDNAGVEVPTDTHCQLDSVEKCELLPSQVDNTEPSDVQNQVDNAPAHDGFPPDWISAEPCACGCGLYRDLGAGPQCVRCWPPKGYHLYESQVDTQYPKAAKVKRVDWKGNHAA